jgi:hypothetical protein
MRIYGSRGSVSIDDPTAPGTPKVLGSLNKWSMSQARTTADVTSFGDTNKTYVVGLPDIKGAIGGFYDSADRTIFDIAMGEAPVTLTLIPDTLQPTYLWSGDAYLDASIDVPATGPVAITGNWVAAGPWTMAPVDPGARKAAPPPVPQHQAAA